MRTVLLIGLGRFGRYTAAKLNELNIQVMAIDHNEEHVNKVLNIVTNAQIGNSTNEEFMRSLGVANYNVCIVAIGDDFMASLETTALLKDLGARHIISRATGKTQEKFLLRNGADEVVFPERELANWTAIRCSSDMISNYIELDSGYSIFEIQTPAAWEEKPIGGINIRAKYGINILGIREQGKLNMNITANTVLSHGSTLLVLGQEKQIHDAFHIA